MNETPDRQNRQATLAQALRALRDDLAVQPMPPPTVLAAAQRAARLVRGVAAAEASSNVDVAEAVHSAGTWRLPRWPGAGARRAAGALAAWGPWAGAATCAIVLGLSLLLALRPPQATQVRETVALTGAAGKATAAPRAEAELIPAMHFVPLVSAERMRALTAAGGSGGAETPAWVVTTELPQERLAAMGLPYDPGHAAERLRAELLIAGSGEVLAVRLLF